jgi:hypothetical protein
MPNIFGTIECKNQSRRLVGSRSKLPYLSRWLACGAPLKKEKRPIEFSRKKRTFAVDYLPAPWCWFGCHNDTWSLWTYHSAYKRNTHPKDLIRCHTSSWLTILWKITTRKNIRHYRLNVDKTDPIIIMSVVVLRTTSMMTSSFCFSSMCIVSLVICVENWPGIWQSTFCLNDTWCGVHFENFIGFTGHHSSNVTCLPLGSDWFIFQILMWNFKQLVFFKHLFANYLFAN